jgi:hypothetical protein
MDKTIAIALRIVQDLSFATFVQSRVLKVPTMETAHEAHFDQQDTQNESLQTRPISFSGLSLQL